MEIYFKPKATHSRIQFFSLRKTNGFRDSETNFIQYLFQRSKLFICFNVVFRIECNEQSFIISSIM